MWGGGSLRLGSRRLPEVGGERLKGKRERKTSLLRRFRYMVISYDVDFWLRKRSRKIWKPDVQVWGWLGRRGWVQRMGVI